MCGARFCTCSDLRGFAKLSCEVGNFGKSFFPLASCAGCCVMHLGSLYSNAALVPFFPRRICPSMLGDEHREAVLAFHRRG